MAEYSTYPLASSIVAGDKILFAQQSTSSEKLVEFTQMVADIALLPIGPAGGDLTGTYPNPTLAVNRITTTVLTAKADIVVATAPATPAVIHVGTDGQLLTADSTQTTGLRWTTVSTTIPDGSLTTAKYADSSVTTVKIAAGNVTTSILADSSVTTSKIVDNNVSLAKLPVATSIGYIGSKTGSGNQISVTINDGSVSWPTNGMAFGFAGGTIDWILGSSNTQKMGMQYTSSGSHFSLYCSLSASNPGFSDGQLTTTVGSYFLNIGNGTGASRVYGAYGIMVSGNPDASFVFGNQALPTTATDGFIYIRTCAGTPTGVPTSFTATVPMVFDTSANKIWIYTSGAWKSTVALT